LSVARLILPLPLLLLLSRVGPLLDDLWLVAAVAVGMERMN
jgi:hypothetical protein